MSGYYLDGDLYYLGRNLPDAIDLLMLRMDGLKTALIFCDPKLGERHLERLPANMRLQRLEATDFRAKEEFLRAALAQGALALALDADPDSLTHRETHATQRALDYVLSFKRQTACL